VKILKTLRTIIKVASILDALLDEFERESAQEQAQKDRLRNKVSDIYQSKEKH
jgi:hypothetical protein